MSYNTLPPYLQAFSGPGSFVDTRTNKIVQYTTEQVTELCKQYHDELQQQQQTWLQEHQRRVQQQGRLQLNQRVLQPRMVQPTPTQQFGYVPQYQVQAQAEPLFCDNGYMNMGMETGNFQPAYLGQDFGQQNAGQQQQPLSTPQNDVQGNFDGYNALFIQFPVQDFQPQGPGSSSSAPVDLTGEDAEEVTAFLTEDLPGTASIDKEASPSPAAVSAPKSDPTAWRDSKDYLTKMLSKAAGCDLFASLKKLPVAKRNKYAMDHWLTKEDALSDMTEMAQYFLEADEMILYRTKWDLIENDLMFDYLGSPEADKKARDDLRAEKDRLQFELRSKKAAKAASVFAAHDGQWIDRMRKPEFVQRFEQAATAKNKRKLRADRDAELERERAEKRSRTEAGPKAGGSRSSRPRSKPKPRQAEAVAEPTAQPNPEWELSVDFMVAGLTDTDVGF